jgi:hypothetical protein
LSPAERRRIASLGGTARHDSLAAARRIADNFRYLAAVNPLRGVRTPSVVRMKAFAGRLPGVDVACRTGDTSQD